jgi:uncharacterized membrane protein
MNPWELHPALIHFPIAFLLAGVVVEVLARIRPRESLSRAASVLIVAGVVTGIPAAIAGVVSYFTVPAHTEAAHTEMAAHVVLASAALLVFALVALARWRQRAQPASALALCASLAGGALLVSAAFLGGKTVLHGGAGVDPQILAADVVHGHRHHGGGDAADDDHAEHDDHAPAHAPAAAAEPAQKAHASAVARRAQPPRRLFDPDEDLRSPWLGR